MTTNGQNDWDTPFGGGNYTIHSPGIYKLKSGKIDRIEG